jgi:hypothetical protein
MTTHVEAGRTMTIPRTSPGSTAAAAPAEPAAPTIVRHTGCPQWGLGWLVEERDDKRIYDFEDGQPHSIARAFWAKLEAVQLQGEELASLESKIKSLKVKPEPPKKPRQRTVTAPAITFDEQVARFTAAYEGGFGGAAYVAKERPAWVEPEAAPAASPESVAAPASEASPEGDGAAEQAAPAAPAPKKKKVKGGIEAVIAAARRELDAAELSAMNAAGNVEGILERVRRVHQAAGDLLHPLGDTIPFAKMAPEHHAPVAQAIVAALHGDGDASERYQAMVTALSAAKLETWPLATVLGAASKPSEHAFVKPSFYEKQALVIGFELGYERTPSAAGYGRMQALARAVEGKLREKGQQPRDLFDVYVFMWRTLSTAKSAKPET